MPRKADLSINHRELDESLSRYRSFLEKIFAAKRVIGTVKEKEDIAESVLLRICANWERFVDRQLIACVNVDPTRLEEFFGVPIPAHPSKNLCAALIFGDQYRDFPRFGALKGFSGKLLPDESNPFLQVTKMQAQRIDEVYIIRNYLSHYSERAGRALSEMYRNKYNIGKFPQPGSFLRAYEAYRFWQYFDAFQGASNRMKEWYVSE